MSKDPARDQLRHILATLAYRVTKVLRDAPPDFGNYSDRAGRRTPVQLVAHMADLMQWGIHMTKGDYTWRAEGGSDWDTEVKRFLDGMAELDRRLSSDEPLGYPPEILIQGPSADALTHTGQLAMLRSGAGSPVRPESYAKAQIVAGRVGMDQAAPGREFDGDASARRP